MSVSVADWLDASTDGLPRGSVRIGADGVSSTVAVALCLTTPIIRAMTPVQREVFRTLCRLQLEQGVHSLLPDVMEAFVQVAFCPWWDARLARLADERD